MNTFWRTFRSALPQDGMVIEIRDLNGTVTDLGKVSEVREGHLTFRTEKCGFMGVNEDVEWREKP
jgi:hypothetical protein